MRGGVQSLRPTYLAEAPPICKLILMNAAWSVGGRFGPWFSPEHPTLVMACPCHRRENIQSSFLGGLTPLQCQKSAVHCVHAAHCTAGAAVVAISISMHYNLFQRTFGHLRLTQVSRHLQE